MQINGPYIRIGASGGVRLDGVPSNLVAIATAVDSIGLTWSNGAYTDQDYISIERGADTFTFIEIDQVFTYNDNAGITEYSPRSNLGKFKKKYGKLPEPGMQIKVTTNSDGFGNLKLD